VKSKSLTSGSSGRMAFRSSYAGQFMGIGPSVRPGLETYNNVADKTQTGQ